ncbi:unnamed protein product [Choristocarpus tenellus]
MDKCRPNYVTLQEAQSPVVLRGATEGWTGMNFVKDLRAAELLTTWRVHPHGSISVWESECFFLDASLGHFYEWERTIPGADLSEGNPFTPFDREGHWAYADYKHIKELAGDRLDILGSLVNWRDLGCDKGVGDSTFWLGSEGSHTPLHHDTYGVNLVAQLHGTKRWTLYPPGDTDSLYPTRVPYEESSVFSQVDVRKPDLTRQAGPMVITLTAGDALYVPKHWWHFVEAEETSLSVNVWRNAPGDDNDRAREAIARVLVTSLAEGLAGEIGPSWLNPTEEIWPLGETLAVAEAAFQRLGVTGKCE